MNAFFGHFCTVTKHKYYVFRLSLIAGIPLRGLLHDMSKFSPAEFFENVKYYCGGVRSPYARERREVGYVPGWLHHKGINKHHFEYWYDDTSPIKCAPMPFVYFAEMICDTVAATMTYQGKSFTLDGPLKYFREKNEPRDINEGIKKAMRQVYEELAQNGIEKTLKKENLRMIYDTHMNKWYEENRIMMPELR